MEVATAVATTEDAREAAEWAAAAKAVAAKAAATAEKTATVTWAGEEVQRAVEGGTEESQQAGWAAPPGEAESTCPARGDRPDDAV